LSPRLLFLHRCFLFLILNRIVYLNIIFNDLLFLLIFVCSAIGILRLFS
jgi:hypothetical protein